jgi:hypothetical protein
MSATMSEAKRREGQTSDDLRALKILIRMQVARGQGEVESDEEQQEIYSAPHDDGGGYVGDD